jgi:hypothetical protein
MKYFLDIKELFFPRRCFVSSVQSPGSKKATLKVSFKRSEANKLLGTSFGADFSYDFTLNDHSLFSSDLKKGGHHEEMIRIPIIKKEKLKVPVSSHCSCDLALTLILPHPEIDERLIGDDNDTIKDKDICASYKLNLLDDLVLTSEMKEGEEVETLDGKPVLGKKNFMISMDLVSGISLRMTLFAIKDEEEDNEADAVIAESGEERRLLMERSHFLNEDTFLSTNGMNSMIHPDQYTPLSLNSDHGHDLSAFSSSSPDSHFLMSRRISSSFDFLQRKSSDLKHLLVDHDPDRLSGNHELLPTVSPSMSAFPSPEKPSSVVVNNHRTTSSSSTSRIKNELAFLEEQSKNDTLSPEKKQSAMVTLLDEQLSTLLQNHQTTFRSPQTKEADYASVYSLYQEKLTTAEERIHLLEEESLQQQVRHEQEKKKLYEEIFLLQEKVNNEEYARKLLTELTMKTDKELAKALSETRDELQHSQNIYEKSSVECQLLREDISYYQKVIKKMTKEKEEEKNTTSQAIQAVVKAIHQKSDLMEENENLIGQLIEIKMKYISNIIELEEEEKKNKNLQKAIHLYLEQIQELELQLTLQNNRNDYPSPSLRRNNSYSQSSFIVPSVDDEDDGNELIEQL